jgi:hypothetical protein
MKRNARIVFTPAAALIAGLIAASGCSQGSKKQVTVLKTEDFIADPATMPTALPASPPQAAPAPAAAPESPRVATPVTVSDAREGVKDVSVSTAAPSKPGQFPAAIPTESMNLVDAKIGEINGRAIRVNEIFEAVGENRLASTARTRRLSPLEWQRLGRPGMDPEREITRPEWRVWIGTLFRGELERTLQDEVLTADARATLKPEQKQGLKYFVQEQTENQRRSVGGSQAELERKLREKNQSEQRFAKNIETNILIQLQIEEKFKNRLKTSWKDVRLYYERNPQIFHPPPKARFRQIVVHEEKGDAVAAIREAFASGKPFAEVAQLPANEYDRAGGGLVADREFKGEFAQASLFSAPALNDAAHKLTPGTYTTEPIEVVDGSGKKVFYWLFLESIVDTTRPLSDPEVQLSIAERLDQDAVEAAVNAYIDRLKARASFTDIDAMADVLVEIASERYWPAGS